MGGRQPRSVSHTDCLSFVSLRKSALTVSFFPRSLASSRQQRLPGGIEKPDCLSANPLDVTLEQAGGSWKAQSQMESDGFARRGPPYGVGVGAIHAITLPAALVKDYYPRCISNLNNPLLTLFSHATSRLTSYSLPLHIMWLCRYCL